MHRMLADILRTEKSQMKRERYTAEELFIKMSNQDKEKEWAVMKILQRRDIELILGD